LICFFKVSRRLFSPAKTHHFRRYRYQHRRIRISIPAASATVSDRQRAPACREHGLHDTII
jgi:hypothetical protein